MSIFHVFRKRQKERKDKFGICPCGIYIFFVNYPYHFLPGICYELFVCEISRQTENFQHNPWVPVGPQTILTHLPPFLLNPSCKTTAAKLQEQSVPLLSTVFEQ